MGSSFDYLLRATFYANSAIATIQGEVQTTLRYVKFESITCILTEIYSADP